MSWLDTLDDIRKKDFSTGTTEVRDQAARDVVNMGSYACAVVAVSPIPFSDAVLMLPVQSAMVMTIGHIYGRKLTQADAKELVVELAATAGLGMLARQGIKALLPVVGALLTVPAAFAANWAIGRVAMEYFSHPGVTREQMKKMYEAARAEGSSLFSKERFDAFRHSVGGKPATPSAEQDTATPDAPAVSQVARLIEGDFAARVAKHQDVREALNGRVHLDISGEGGGQWTVDFTAPQDFVSRGLEGTAVLTVRCGAAAFGALLEGSLSAQAALTSGTLVLDPMDLDLAMKLGPLFKP